MKLRSPALKGVTGAIAFAVAAFCAPSQTSSGGNAVTAIRFWSLHETTRVAIELTGAVEFHAEQIDNPSRLFFDVQGARLLLAKKGQRTIVVGDQLLKQIRVAETQPGTTRVVLDLESDIEYTASQLSNPDRLIVELRKADKKPVLTGAPLMTASAPVRVPQIPAEPPAAVPVSATPMLSVSPVPPLPLATDKPLISNDPTSIALLKAEKLGRALIIRETPYEPNRESRPDSANAKVSAPLAPLSQPKAEPPAKDKSRTLLASASLSSSPSAVPGPITSKPLTTPKVEPAIVESDRQESTLKPPETAKADPAKQDPPKRNPIRPEPGSKAYAAKLSTQGDASLTRVLGLKLGRIVLDAGHGGHDTGTQSPTGLVEKELVLDIALRLGALIESRMGSEVVYTRTDDTFIPLERRTEIANDHRADLFLSIHANSSPATSASGVEAYYLNFTTSQSALEVAARENASSERTVHDLKDLLQQIALRDKVDESKRFAERVESSLFNLSSHTNVRSKNRGVKKAPFVVLIGASMPSVLVEVGFVTNPKDETMMKRPEYRQKMAEALYKGLSQYAGTLSHFQVASK